MFPLSDQNNQIESFQCAALKMTKNDFSIFLADSVILNTETCSKRKTFFVAELSFRAPAAEKHRTFGLYGKGVVIMRTPIDRLAVLLMIVGAINWLTVGLFGYDFVASIFGGVDALGSRIVYSLVGIAGIYSISLLFREAPASE